MDVLSRIGIWLSDHEAMISAVVGIAVLAGILFTGIRFLLGRRTEIKPEEDPLLALPTGPVVAVLPFENLSRDPEQEYFSDGLTDDIITALSRFEDLFVIARNSTFRYKDRAVDVRQLNRELGARYVLEGSVQKVGDTLRVTAQLLDARDGTHLWAETYDRELSASNIFAIQDEITEQVVGTIAGLSGVISRVRFAEIKEKPIDRLDAYKCVLRWGAVLIGCIALGGVGYAVYATNRAAIQSYLMLTLPKYLGNPIEQQVGFATTSDGVRIAYATTGQGPALVHVVGWATHLERGVGSPLYDSSDGIRWLSRRNLYVRYDGRGFGLSDRDVADFSLDARVRDLEAVVDTLGLDRFSILAMSMGGPTAIAYAARHPEKVSRIVFLSCAVSSASLVARMSEHPVIGSERQYFAMLEMIRSDWSSPIVRGMMADLLFPEVDPAGRRVLIEFLRVSGEGAAVASFLETMADATDLARHVKARSLVIHTRDDPAIPLSHGRLLASLIPGARLEIPDGGHIPWTPAVLEAISDFLAEDQPAPRGSGVE